MYFVIKEIQSKFTRTPPMLFTRLLPKLSRTLPMLSTRTLPKPFTRALRQRTPPHITHMLSPLSRSHLRTLLTCPSPCSRNPHIIHTSLAYCSHIHIACISLAHHSHIACISLAHRLHIAHISLACCFAFVDSSLRSPAETFSARHLAGLLTCPRATPSSRFPERTTSSSDSLSVETVTSVGCPMKKDLQLRV